MLFARLWLVVGYAGLLLFQYPTLPYITEWVQKVKGILVSIGTKVKEIRKALGGISQADLARRLGITPNAVAAWEQGVREPDGINCLRLSQLSTGELSDFFAGQVGVAGSTTSNSPVPSDASIEKLQTAVTEGFGRVEKLLSLVLERLDSQSAKRANAKRSKRSSER